MVSSQLSHSQALAMASSISPLFQLQSLSSNRLRNTRTTLCQAHTPKRAPACLTTELPAKTRRQALLFLTATVTVAGIERPSMADDIPLFGLRKKFKKAEEQAEEIVREGFEAAEMGIETAEKGIETVEKGLETAEKGLETAEKGLERVLSFGGLAQAGVVAVAEVIGVLVATGIVNGILGSEVQKS